jgi:hypothetical protein
LPKQNSPAETGGVAATIVAPADNNTAAQHRFLRMMLLPTKNRCHLAPEGGQIRHLFYRQSICLAVDVVGPAVEELLDLAAVRSQNASSEESQWGGKSPRCNSCRTVTQNVFEKVLLGCKR